MEKIQTTNQQQQQHRLNYDKQNMNCLFLIFNTLRLINKLCKYEEEEAAKKPSDCEACLRRFQSSGSMSIHVYIGIDSSIFVGKH